jgi:C4-dicarboxylate-specific signal transduction histidine kinase
MCQLRGDVVASPGGHTFRQRYGRLRASQFAVRWRRAGQAFKNSHSRVGYAATNSNAARLRRELSRAYSRCVLVASLLSFPSTFCSPATASDPARIIIINAWADSMPAAARATAAIRQGFDASPLKNAEIYYDTLDLGRFPDRIHEERMARLLSEKYAGKRPNIIIALGRVALDYLLRHRDTIAPGVPIIVCYWAGATPSSVASLSNVTGVISEFNWAKTFDLAARLQPEARDVVIVSGASVLVWEKDAREQLAARLGRYKVRNLNGLPYDTLLREVAQLPRNTIVLILPIFMDGNGISRIPAVAAGDVARASSAPSYAPIDTFLGNGIVGGYFNTFEGTGAATAKLALEVINRKGATELPPPITTPHNFVVDARQLQRWGLSQSNLPEATEVAFREPTLWEQHRNSVLVAASVFALMTACLVALSLQVLKRRRAEATLEASERRMKFSAASTQTGLWQYDIQTGQVWATDYCRRMFDLDLETPLAPDAFLSAVHPDDRAVPMAAMQATGRTTGTVGRDEFRVVRRNQDIRWYLATTNIESGKSDEPVRVSGIFRDVTERKQAELEAERLETALRGMQRELSRVSRQTTVTAMAASIAHEINQPLSALVTNGGIGLRLLAKSNLNLDEMRDVLNRIIEDGHRVSEIIAGIRSIFRKEPRALAEVSIHELIPEVVALVRGDLESHRVALSVDLHRDLPPVFADRVQLQEVLLNLIMNAIEAMSSLQDRKRSLLVKSEPAGQDDVLIAVEDNGPGINADDMKQIFDAFFTTKSHGMGLGLSICRLIVQAHGGRLWASTKVPYGAIFYVRLPSNSAQRFKHGYYRE